MLCVLQLLQNHLVSPTVRHVLPLLLLLLLLCLQLLPNRLVSPGVRNLVPLLLWILGTIIWGVQAAQLQHHVSAGAGDNNVAVVHWRDTTLVSKAPRSPLLKTLVSKAPHSPLLKRGHAMHHRLGVTSAVVVCLQRLSCAPTVACYSPLHEPVSTLSCIARCVLPTTS
jgi:hypothetical protein